MKLLKNLGFRTRLASAKKFGKLVPINERQKTETSTETESRGVYKEQT